MRINYQTKIKKIIMNILIHLETVKLKKHPEKIQEIDLGKIKRRKINLYSKIIL